MLWTDQSYDPSLGGFNFECLDCDDGRQLTSLDGLLKHCQFAAAHKGRWCKMCRQMFSGSLVLGSGPLLTNLQWQSETGDFEDLEITISIEVGQHADEYPQS